MLPSLVTVRPYRCRYQLPPPITKEPESSRTDTAKHSLLTLPGEIRNIILGIPLVQPECYSLTNVRDEANAGSKLQNDGDFAELKGLLLSCRQIYHEASSMFFMENQFSIKDQGDEYGFRYYNNHVRQAGIWLQSLGSQLSLVRGVTIEGYDHFDPPVHVFTIVQAYWTSLVTVPLSLSVEIAPSSQSIQAISHNYSPEHYSGMDCGRLTNIVKTLAHDNDLNICRFRLAIKDIDIDGNCKYGYIYWKRSRSQHRYMRTYGVRTRFKPTNDGLVLHFDPLKQPHLRYCVDWPPHSSLKGFQGLPHEVDEYLWRTILISNIPVNVDLDTTTWTGPSPNALHERSQWIQPYWKSNTFTVGMRSAEDRSSFSRFGCFRLWLCYFSSNTYPWAARKVVWKDGLKIVLQSELDNSLETRDTIRVSIMDLIRMTSHISTENVVQINIQGAWESAVDIPLKLLRQRALRFLSDLHATHPDYYTRACPELWIDGSGIIVEATQGPRDTTMWMTRSLIEIA
jgi:hypothetical protein